MRMIAERSIRLLSLGLVVMFLMAIPNRTQAQQTEVSFQVFYDELAPYGRWMLHPKFGDVWAPTVQGEFTPYLTNGYWTVTQYGNTWVSNYDWGWAPFHYGRWYFDEFEGWIWIPDTTWAPAWVVWRNGGGYYGWAPLSPGLNFSISFNLFNDIPNFYWCFVPRQYVWRPFAYRYCAPRDRNVYIVQNTTYITHYHGDTYNYYSGPSHTEITNVTNRPVVIHNVQHYNRPGRAQVDNDRIALYKPIVVQSPEAKPTITKGNYSSHNGWYQNGERPVRGTGNSNGSTGNDSRGNNGHGNGDQNAPGNSGDNNNAENSENSGNGNSGSRWTSDSNRKPTYQQSSDDDWRTNESSTQRTPRPAPIRKSSSNEGSSWSGQRSVPTQSSSPRTQESKPVYRSAPATRQPSSGSGVQRSTSSGTGSRGTVRSGNTPVVSKPAVTRTPVSSTPRSVPQKNGTPSRSSGGSGKGKPRD